MRTATIFILAAALAATPAVAQNEAVVANTADATTPNQAAPADMNATVPANEVAAAPVVAPEDTAVQAPAPAPQKDRDLPWGAIGLVGLVGLLGRKRRND